MKHLLRFCIVFAILAATPSLTAQIKDIEKGYTDLHPLILKAAIELGNGDKIMSVYFPENDRICEGKGGGTTFALIRVNREGEIVWTKCPEYGTAIIESISISADGQYFFIGGYTNHRIREDHLGHDMDAWVMKSDLDGNIIWNRAFGKHKVTTHANTVEATSDGGCIIAGKVYEHSKMEKTGHVDMDIKIYKLNKDGDLEWDQRVDNGPLWEQVNDIEATTDGGYILGCNATGRKKDRVRNGTAWLIKLDASGKKEWKRRYGGGQHDFIASVIQDRSGGYVFIGRESGHESNRAANCGRRGLWIVSVNKKGKTKWQHFFENRSPAKESYGKSRSLLQLEDGTFLFGGTNLDTIRNGNPWLARFAEEGELIWDTTFNTPYCEGFRAIEKTSKGFVGLGWLSNYDKGPLHFDSWWMDFQPNTDPFPTITDTTDTDSIVVSIEDITENSGVEESRHLFVNFPKSEAGYVQLYPNPATSSINLHFDRSYRKVELRLVNASGKLVYKNSWEKQQDILIEMDSLPAGWYSAQVLYDDQQSLIKLIKE